MKNTCLLTRRAGTTRQAFRDYYESRHAPLGMKYFPFEKYLRNHVIEASSEIDFDVIMESYFDDDVDVAAIDHGDARAVLDKDERAFMTPGMIRAVGVDEQVLGGPPIDVAAPGTRRLMLLVNPKAQAERPSFEEALRRWGADLARSSAVGRVSLDTARQPIGGERDFPYAAILSLWLKADTDSIDTSAVPDALRLEVSVLTEVHETPSADLAARYGS